MYVLSLNTPIVLGSVKEQNNYEDLKWQRYSTLFASREAKGDFSTPSLDENDIKEGLSLDMIKDRVGIKFGREEKKVNSLTALQIARTTAFTLLFVPMHEHYHAHAHAHIKVYHDTFTTTLACPSPGPHFHSSILMSSMVSILPNFVQQKP